MGETDRLAQRAEYEYAEWAQWANGRRTEAEIEIEGMRLVAPRPDSDPRPLLEQCAAVIDMALGNAPAAGGIIDELRRVRAALAKEGW